MVADELRLDRFDLLGISMAAPVSAAFAASHPDRVGRLVLYGGYANGRRIASAGVAAAMVDLVQAHWGSVYVLADVFPARRQRRGQGTLRAAAGATPHRRRSLPELLAQCYELEVEGLLDQIAAPTLVLHRAATGRFPTASVATSPPASRARLVSLAGRSHLPYAGDAAAVIGAILAFLEPSAGKPRPAPPVRSAGALTARRSRSPRWSPRG